MNPKTKLVLDGLTKRSDDLEATWAKSFSDAEEKLEEKLKKSLAESEEKWEPRFEKSDDKWERQFADLKISQDARVAQLKRITTTLDKWKPEVEVTMDDIRIEVERLSRHWEPSVRDRPPPLLPSTTAPMLLSSRDDKYTAVNSTPPSVSERPSAEDVADRPPGHCFLDINREDGFGSVTTLIHPPVKGTIPDSSHMLAKSYLHPSRSQPRMESARSNYSKLHKLNFLVFDGESPKLWISRCEDYFDLYDVVPHDWIKVQSMHFVDPAARWLQSVGKRVRSGS
jgi:hypothetical protein